MNQHTVALTRVFDAPRKRVFECWTRAEHLAAPERLVIECTADEHLHEVIQVNFTESGGRTTVAVNAVASGSGDEAAAMLKGMDKGWAQTVDRLGAHLKGR